MTEYKGTFHSTIDADGRIQLPIEWKGTGFESSFCVAPSRKGCIAVFPISYLSLLQRERDALPENDPNRLKIEALLQIVPRSELSNDGCLTINPTLREVAKLQVSVELVGCNDRFEIWSANPKV